MKPRMIKGVGKRQKRQRKAERELKGWTVRAAQGYSQLCAGIRENNVA